MNDKLVPIQRLSLISTSHSNTTRNYSAMQSCNIVLIGAGRVATKLGSALMKAKAGFRVLQVFNRSSENGQKLSDMLRAEYVSCTDQITSDADLYIIAVKDGAISEVARKLHDSIHAKSNVVHVSGATPTSVLSSYFEKCGCFYPLQTFSHEKEVDFRQVPICIYSSHPQLEKLLLNIASNISAHVHRVDDQQRSVLHVAAVFANNFTNHLFHKAKDILDKANLPFSLLRPLVDETVEKIKCLDPRSAQTGPAARDDKLTMQKHLELLDYDPSLRSIYETLSESISKTHSSSNK